MSESLELIKSEVSRCGNPAELGLVNALAVILAEADNQVLDVKTRYDSLKSCAVPMTLRDIEAACGGMVSNAGTPLNYNTIREEFRLRGWNKEGVPAYRCGMAEKGEPGWNRKYYPPVRIQEFAAKAAAAVWQRQTRKLEEAFRVFAKECAIFLKLKCETFQALEVGEAAQLQRFIAGFLGASGITPVSFRGSLDTPAGQDIYNQATRIYFDSQLKPWLVNEVKPQMDALRRDAAEAAKKAESFRVYASSKHGTTLPGYLELKAAGYKVCQENEKLKNDLAQALAELTAYKATHPDKDSSPEAIYTVSAYVKWVLGEKMNPDKYLDVIKHLRSKNYFPVDGLTPLHWAKSNLDKEAANILRIIRPAPSKAVLPC